MVLNEDNTSLEIKSEPQIVKKESIICEIKTENCHTKINIENIFSKEFSQFENKKINYSFSQENLSCIQESAHIKEDKDCDQLDGKYEQCQDFSQDVQIGQAQTQSFAKLDSTKLSQLIEPEQFRKVFIGGLSYKTNEEKFEAYFSKYGELVDHVVMKDRETDKSRGFGFVTYSSSSMVDELMRNRPHVIGGRQVEAKRATPREDSGRQEIQATVKKLYISGIRDCLSEDDLNSYFSRYGNITDSIVMKDKETNKTRGFAFITFDDYDPVDKIILLRHHSINGIELKCEKAIPRENNMKKMPSNQNLNFQFGQNFGANTNVWTNRTNVTNDFQMSGQFPQYAKCLKNQQSFYNQLTKRGGGPIRREHGHFTARFQGSYAGNFFLKYNKINKIRDKVKMS